jgi:hypothetical protein
MTALSKLSPTVPIEGEARLLHSRGDRRGGELGPVIGVDDRPDGRPSCQRDPPPQAVELGTSSTTWKDPMMTTGPRRGRFGALRENDPILEGLAHAATTWG